MKKIIPIIFLLICAGSQIADKASAHYIQTHQYIIHLAMESLVNDNESLRNGQNTKYIDFLVTTFIDKNGVSKDYLRMLMEGVRDADRRANGLFEFRGEWYGNEIDGWDWEAKEWNDCWDWDLNIACTPENSIDKNDIGHWPIGDHGYRSATDTEPERGYYSLRNIDEYMTRIKSEELHEQIDPVTGIKIFIQTSVEARKLIEKIQEIYEFKTLEDAEFKLKDLLMKANAVDMADHFYQQALKEWNLNHINDAMYNLGIALHLIQDLTVPHHARLLGDTVPEGSDENAKGHKDYETEIWTNTLMEGSKSYSALSLDDRSVVWYLRKTPKEWARENAAIISDPIKISLDPDTSGEKVVKLAVQSTVGAIYSFFRDVSYGESSALPWLSLLLMDDVSIVDCGAYIAPGVWKEFDCYNLAAIGKTTNDDPFTPSWRLNGGYWQWGRKGPDSSQWYTTNTPNFAHGPTGSGSSEANSGSISGWETSYVSGGTWSDSEKTALDPCPSGYRVPTKAQWDGVVENNTQSTVGTWSTTYNDHTNYNAGRFFGEYLMLPATGDRWSPNGELSGRGEIGTYWSTTEGPYEFVHAFALISRSDYAFTAWNDTTNAMGFSVRCISE